MSRMRIMGLVVFTFFALLMLALTVGGMVEGVRDGHHWPLVDMVCGLVFAVAMTGASAGLWFRHAVRAKNRHAATLPLAFAQRSKYAVWASRPHAQAGNAARRGAVRTRKTLRRKG